MVIDMASKTASLRRAHNREDRVMKTLALPISLCLLAYSALAAQGHEFWIAPDDYTVAVGTTITANLRVGSDMKGVPQPYITDNIARFDLVTGDTVVPVTGRLGDQPAMAAVAPADGLAIVVHETTDTTLTYREYNVFNRFVGHKNLDGVLAQHDARGLPHEKFQESYARHAKCLIAVGSGAGADHAFGLKVEIVALTNPYTDDLTDGMNLQVLLDGQPRADAQLELFGTFPDGTMKRVVYRTDGQGMVNITVEPGVAYLADNVAMTALPNDDAGAGPVWHSDWASLTFQVPPAP
jgi:uncharacterized GH25 family protein